MALMEIGEVEGLYSLPVHRHRYLQMEAQIMLAQGFEHLPTAKEC